MFETDRRFKQSQKVYLAVGCPLIACRTQESIGVTNNSFWTCVGIQPLTVESEDGSTRLEIDPASFQRNWRLAHALTYQQSQGRTLEGIVHLLETTSDHCTEKHLRVGLSRARAARLLSVLP